MKLNLLPATVSRGRQTKTAWVVSIVIIFVGIGIAAAATITSAQNLEQAKADYEASKPGAERALATSQKADQIMARPDVQALVRNVALAQAMIQHNDKYPDLYNRLLPFVPSFYRLTSLAAQPVNEGQTVVTMTGTLESYQQYADLMMALMRNPEAVSVSRSGFQSEDPFVPNLTQVDQAGRPRKPGEQPIPDDPLERLAFFEAQGSTESFSGVGNFGTGTESTRGAMPGESLVTVQIVLNAPLQVPNPRQTLAAGGGGGAPQPGGGAPAMNVPAGGGLGDPGLAGGETKSGQ